MFAPCSPVCLLRSDVPAVVKATARQVSEKSAKTRVGALVVARELVAVVPDSIAQQASLLMPGVLQVSQASRSLPMWRAMQTVNHFDVLHGLSFLFRPFLMPGVLQVELLSGGKRVAA